MRRNNQHHHRVCPLPNQLFRKKLHTSSQRMEEKEGGRRERSKLYVRVGRITTRGARTVSFAFFWRDYECERSTKSEFGVQVRLARLFKLKTVRHRPPTCVRAVTHAGQTRNEFLKQREKRSIGDHDVFYLMGACRSQSREEKNLSFLGQPTRLKFSASSDLLVESREEQNDCCACAEILRISNASTRRPEDCTRAWRASCCLLLQLQF